MKNKFNYFGSIGIIIYIIISLIDRVVYKLPDLVYIVSLLIAFVMLVIGIILDRKNKGNKQ